MVSSARLRGLVKGALLAHDPATGQTQSVAFQLNPDSIKRRVLAATSSGNGAGSQEPRERITLELAVDAQLDESFASGGNGGDNGHGNGDSEWVGVLGFLSAVELLVYPPGEAGAPARGSGAASGGLFGWLSSLFGVEIGKPARFVCLRLGPERLIPVAVRSLHITEQAFDAELRPVRAALRLVLDTLTETESNRHPFTRSVYEAYMRSKARLAKTALQTQ